MRGSDSTNENLNAESDPFVYNIDIPAELSLFKEGRMRITGTFMGVIAIILGILVLVLPDLIRWFIGVGLIVMGIMALVRR